LFKFAQELTSATRALWQSLAEGMRKVRALPAQYKAIQNAREERGIDLPREWLSPTQRAQFDASKSFDVIGCDSGRRYRILYGKVTNIHEIDDTGRAVMGWCFVPSDHLVTGDVMLAQKIALETNERATLTVANRFNVQVPQRYSPARV
jgi:hypothetical protein